MVHPTFRTQVVLGRKHKAKDKTHELLLPLRELGPVSTRQLAVGRGDDVDPDRARQVARIRDERCKVLASSGVSDKPLFTSLSVALVRRRVAEHEQETHNHGQQRDCLEQRQPPDLPTLFDSPISRPYTIAEVATPAEKSVKRSTGRRTTGIIDERRTSTSSHHDTLDTWGESAGNTHPRLAVLNALHRQQRVERRAWLGNRPLVSARASKPPPMPWTSSS